MKKLTALLLATLLLFAAAGCSGSSSSAPASGPASSQAPAEKTDLIFADVGWDSIKFHNAVAGLVAEKVFGYTWSETPASTPISHEALIQGEIDVHMEVWTDNLPDYQGDVDAGKLTELGVNFDDNIQGFYIPKYVADANPGLKSVEDLKDYANLFPDPESPGKARIFGGIPGWEITEIMEKKVQYYGLDEQYNYVIPGSDAAMNATIISAWDKQEPVVFYYWEPTWLMGLYDFVLLEDAPYDAATYHEGQTACPSVSVNVCVSNAFAASNPEFCEFLSKYRTSSALTSEGLAYLQENAGSTYTDAAVWFLTEGHPELVDQFLTAEQAATLREALQG